MSRPNSVTIFSNGIANFSRHYRVKAGTPCQVTIAAKRKSVNQAGHLGDLVSSIDVLSTPGSIHLSELPNYAPSAEKPDLDFSGDRFIERLATQLKGASVVVKTAPNIVGKLCGLDTEEQDHGTYKVQRRFLNVLVENNTIRRVALDTFADLYFADPTIQAEIQKSLAYQLDQIKPDDALLRLTLEATQGDAEATVQYTMPTAAPKLSYRLRLLDERLALEGYAIVDNPTSDDWENYFVSIVTGDPITFTTDLADVRLPLRGHVNIVADTAPSAVEIKGITSSESSSSAGKSRARRERSFAFSAASVVAEDVPAAAPPPFSAMSPVTEEAIEVGDFSVFTTAEPVTVPAHRSVVVPIFKLSLRDDGESLILYYRKNDNRAMRCACFANEAKFTLGKGKCEVYRGDQWQGSALLSTTKPGQTVMLAHAVETGVQCFIEQRPIQSQITAVHISDGILLCESTRRAQLCYTFRNLKEEKFFVYVEHDRLIAHSELLYKAAKVKECEQNGKPVFRCELPPRDKFELLIEEQKVDAQQIQTGNMMSWLHQNIVATENPLGNNSGIRACVAIQEEIDGLTREIRSVQTKIQNINNEQERLRKNITATVGSGPDLEIWRRRLASSESELIRLENEVLPDLDNRLHTMQERLHKSLQKLSASWKQQRRE